jgi:hypothetical protein
MSYDSSHRTPPRQERWPQATPAESWPSYRDGAEEQASRQDARAERPAGSHRRQPGPRSAVITAAFPVGEDAHGTTNAHDTGAYRVGNHDTGAYDTGGYRVGGIPDGRTRADPGRGRVADEYAADDFDWARIGYAGSPGGHAGTESGYDRAADGYSGTGDGYAGAGNGSVPDGYPSGGAYLGPGSHTETAYSGTAYPGTAYPGTAYPGTAYSDPGYSDAGYSSPAYSEPGYSGTEYSDPGYSDPGYSDPGYSGSGYSGSGYFDSGYSGQMLTAPDAGVHPGSWQADQAHRRASGYRGLMVSAAAEFLATAVVIGVSTLAAGLLRSPVPPVAALGTVFIDRTPAMLRVFALHHFGAHGRTVLLLGMYALIAVVAIVIGAAARRTAAFGVAGVAAFTLVTAFVAVTRPASQVPDVMPAVIGGLAGVAALLWLVRASAPVPELTPLRPVRGGTRRRTR